MGSFIQLTKVKEENNYYYEIRQAKNVNFLTKNKITDFHKKK